MTRLRGASRGAFCNQLERLFGQGTSIGSSEGELLERFVTGHDEAAFEALVARHGPMVLGVCRQLLRDPNDVDDAFQATFLVLVRKAGSLRRRDLLGNWLYGVAYRVAARARGLSARRNSRMAPGQDSVERLASLECGQEVGLNQTGLLEQGPWLHQEVSYLPEKYRAPIVLCYFEGLTHDEAASRLGWPLGTVKGRLARARNLLRRRLTRRGVTVSATALGAHLAGVEAKAAVPAALRLTTLKAASALTCQAGASLARSSAVSLPVSALAQGVLNIMIANQIKSIALTALLVLGTVSTGVIVGASQLSGGSTSAGKGDQIPAASTDSLVSGTGAQVAVRKAAGASLSVSPQLAHQLKGESTLFDQLLSNFRDPEIDDIDRLSRWDIDRLSRWSSLTLEADQVLAKTQTDHVAAHEAHRDRMKKLHEFTQKIPISDNNQSVKADHARVVLQQAELGLENAKTNSAQVADDSIPDRPRSSEAPKLEVTAAGTGQAGAGGNAQEKANAEQPKASARPRGQTRAPAGMGSMGGGMGGMGGGMGGMGGGMGGMGGMVGGMGGMGGMGGGGMMGAFSPESVNRQLRWSIAASAADLASRDANPMSRAVLRKLEQPVSMSFAKETPLEDVLKYIKQVTTTDPTVAIPVYVDPKGLKEAEATLLSCVRLDLEGVPLKTTLRLMLKQIGLAYCVRDGVLMISSVQGIDEELREAQRELEAKDPQPDRPRGLGGFGGNGGGGMR